MEPFRRLTALAAPMMRQNLNTDLMIRVDRLTALQREPIGRWAFETLRYRPDGSEDPDFILNRPPWRQARILLNDINCGVGSSREGAVWALQDFGIACVIAPSFGDIFVGNCFQNGVLPIELPRAEVLALAAAAEAGPNMPFTVDLEAQTVTTPNGMCFGFSVEARRREMLLAGLDEIGLTLTREAEIQAFQSRDRSARPWVYSY